MGGYGMAYPDYNYSYPAVGGYGYSSGYSGVAATVTQQRYLGIDEEPAVAPDGVRGMRITKVFAGLPAEQAGLQVGDVLISANGYKTEVNGNLAWIIANALPDNSLKINYKALKDGQIHQVVARIP